MLTIKETTIPLKVDEIKEFFTNKDLLYFINYSKSTLKGVVFLTYLSNLDLPFEVNFSDSSFEEKEELFKIYMTSRNITRSETLRLNLAKILLEHRGLPAEGMFDNLIFSKSEIATFIDNNAELLNKWENFLESTLLFAISSIEELEKKFKVREKYEVINEPQYIGSNIVNFFSISAFMELYFTKEVKTPLKYFKPQFEESVFQGKNLYSFYAVEENLMFQVFLGLINGEIGFKELGALNTLFEKQNLAFSE